MADKLVTIATFSTPFDANMGNQILCRDLPGFENLAGLVDTSPKLSPWSKSHRDLPYPIRQR